MPGSSLWLVPPTTHPLYRSLSALIDETLPSRFSDEPRPSFAPHITLTSNINPATYGDNPQRWLESIPWPAFSDVRVDFEAVKTEDVFVRRCYLKVVFNGEIRHIAGLARAYGVTQETGIGLRTEAWLEQWSAAFGPHLSLMYGNNPIDDTSIKEVTAIVGAAGVKLDGTEAWEGGSLWLVPTSRPIAEWTPLATKQL